MPEFRFFLVGQDQQFPLGEGVELPDAAAARRHAKLAILKVFRNLQDNHDWSDWRLSIRDDNGEELEPVPIGETLTELGRASRGT